MEKEGKKGARERKERNERENGRRVGNASIKTLGSSFNPPSILIILTRWPCSFRSLLSQLIGQFYDGYVHEDPGIYQIEW